MGGRSLIVLGLALAGPLAHAATPARSAPKAAAGTPIAADPALVSGTLPNGLRYLILPRAAPKGALHLRLAVRVGSLDETDEERGGAHFIEHLAFHGMEGMDEARLDRSFAALGVGFGRDRNAATGFDSTVYKLDLPKADAAALDLGFSWLRHVADDRRAPSAEEIATERGVIEAEREARSDPDIDIVEAALTFVAPDLRATARWPIGTPESLAAMTPQRLLAFRRRWYRPSNALLIVAGDWPAADLRRRVESAFGGWAEEGPRPPRAPPGRLDAGRGLEAQTQVDPEGRPRLQVCRAGPGPDEPAAVDTASLRRQLRRRLWRLVLQSRLSLRAIEPETPLLRATLNEQNPDPVALRLACVRAEGAQDGWRAALGVVAEEVARLAELGPTEDEAAGALQTLRSAVLIPTLRPTPSDEAADELAKAALAGEPYPAAAEALRAFDKAADGLKAADVRAAFREDWAGAGPLVFVSDPLGPEPAAVTQAWTEATARALAPAPPPTMTTAWPYRSFGPPGAIVRRERFDDAGFTRATFANGVVLNLKRTAPDSHEVDLVVLFGEGPDGLAPEQIGAAAIGMALLPALGLGRIDGTDLAREFGSRPFVGSVEPRAYRIKARLLPATLPRELQLIAAELSDPGFRLQSRRLEAMLGLVKGAYQDKPRLTAQAALYDRIAPGAGLGEVAMSNLSHTTLADIRQVLQAPLTRGPVEISIAGDIQEEDALRMVQATLGALPARDPASVAAAPGADTAAPAPAPAEPLRVTHEGPRDKAVALLAWPLFADTPARLRETAALDLLGDILAEAVRRDLRERQGKTYSPTAGRLDDDGGPFGAMEVVVETAPGDVDAAAQEVRRIAARLAKGEFDADDLEAARRPRLASLETEAQGAQGWAQALAGSSRGLARPADRVREADRLRSIRLDEVKAAAAAWLGPAPWVVLARPPA